LGCGEKACEEPISFFGMTFCLQYERWRGEVQAMSMVLFASVFMCEELVYSFVASIRGRAFLFQTLLCYQEC